jgi:hypothetical protein
MTIDFQAVATYGTFLFMGIASISIAVTSLRKGRSESIEDSERTIELMKSRISALEISLTETKVSLASEHDNVVKLQTELKLKDQTIKEYLDILRNRDPALSEFIKSTTLSMQTVMKGIEELLKTERSITVTTKS